MNVAWKWLLSSVFFFAFAQVHAQNVNGVLRVVKGDVQVKSAKSGETSKAKLGQQVFPKDVIITGKDARAKIVMVDNNEINVSPESQIEIQHYEFDPGAGKKDVLLNVIYGKVRAKVEQKYDGKTSKFQVKTPAAVAGVRGTDFMTSFDRQTSNSQIITFRGKVEFGLPGPNGTIQNAVFVTPGTTASSTAGKSPAPAAAMPKEQLAKMDNETKAEGGPTTGGSKGDRQPSNDGGDKKKSSDGSSADSSKGDGSAKNDSGKSSGRDPASAGSGSASSSTSSSGSSTSSMAPPAPGPSAGSMIDTHADSATNVMNGPPPPPPVVIAPPPPPTQVNPVKPPDVSNLLQNGNSNLNVHIKKGN